MAAETSSRRLDKFVRSVVAETTNGCSAPVVQIVRTVVRLVLAKTSQREPWFTPKEKGRMIQSFKKTAQVLQAVTDDHSTEQIVAKYWLDLELCKMMQGSFEPPAKPAAATSPLFVGWLSKFFSRARAKLDGRVLYSLQKGCKTDWPRLAASREQAALDSHKEAVGKPHGGLPPEMFEEIVKESKAVARRAPKSQTKMMPSTHSNLQAKYGLGAKSLFPLLELPTKETDPAVSGTHFYLHRVSQAFDDWKQSTFDLSIEGVVDRVKEWENAQRGIGPTPSDRDVDAAIAVVTSDRSPELRSLRVVEDGYSFNVPSHAAYLAQEVFGLLFFETSVEEWATIHKSDALAHQPRSLAKLAAQAYITQVRKAYHVRYLRRINPQIHDVEVVSLAEPTKFRLITKMDGYGVTAMQPLQGQMLSAWKKHPSSTMLHDNLQPLFERMFGLVNYKVVFDFIQTLTITSAIREQVLKDYKLYGISGDYKSATDLLKKHATLAALSGFSDFIGYDIALLFHQEGFAFYPDGDVVRVRDAQLMGHPLSFPLLCIINSAVLNRTLAKWIDESPTWFDRKIRKFLAPLINKGKVINGDDIAFVAPASLYALFEPTAAEVGFKISVGKNYRSETHIMANSQLFRFTGVSAPGQVTVNRQMYFNQRLLTGLNVKRSGQEGEASLARPTEIKNELNRTLDNISWLRVIVPDVMGRWQKEWYSRTFRPNWYLPVHLGGMGIDPKYAPPSLKITRDQRYMAARFLHEPRLGLYYSTGSKATVKQIDYLCSIETFTFVPGSTVLPAHQVARTDVNVGWMARAAAVAHASFEKDPEVKDEVLISQALRRIPKSSRRLKPMSLSGIESYSTGQWVATRTLPCPPLRPLVQRTQLEYRWPEDGPTRELVLLERDTTAHFGWSRGKTGWTPVTAEQFEHGVRERWAFAPFSPADYSLTHWGSLLDTPEWPGIVIDPPLWA